MTPGELIEVINARIEDRNQTMEFTDTLNGVLCSLLANVNRGSDTDPFSPSDFTILKPRVVEEEHPEMIEDKLKLLEAAGLVHRDLPKGV